MIRKTRLVSRADVMLVRVEVFEAGVMKSTEFRLSSPTASKRFPSLDRAIKAFRVAVGRPAEKTPLKTAA